MSTSGQHAASCSVQREQQGGLATAAPYPERAKAPVVAASHSLAKLERWGHHKAENTPLGQSVAALEPAFVLYILIQTRTLGYQLFWRFLRSPDIMLLRPSREALYTK